MKLGKYNTMLETIEEHKINVSRSEGNTLSNILLITNFIYCYRTSENI